jgi:hypothetical protein
MLRRTLLLLAAAMLAMLCTSAHAIAAGMDGIIMQDGKMMMMKAGKAMDPMAASITMSNGAVAMSDGTVKEPGGQEIHLKDGQMVMMDGTIMDGGKPKPMMKPKGMDASE